MDYELIVFDWDGTLMDSEARIIASMQAAFVELGRSPPPAEAVREVIGLGLEQAIGRLWPAASAARRVQAMTGYRQHFLAQDQTPMPLFSGATALLRALHRHGRLLGVATGKSRIGLDQAIADSGLHGLFQATRSADETFSKPHPAMLLELMDELGMRPAQTLMVGDTEYDLQMAANAGVAAVAVTYGAHPRARLLAQQPRACVDSLPELAAWLGVGSLD
ncbi:MAG: HAD family hydrolase [Chromatiaceae bacterium]|nr:MAG: HAD family hydrolase [Chromatiaceae bacterium]